MSQQHSNSAKKRGLGRGLEALLGSKNALDAVGQSNATTDRALQRLPIEQLQPGQYQPRVQIDEAKLDELSASIRVQGIIQPIIVRPLADQRYEIVAGERRWRAAQRAGLCDVPVILRELDDRTVIAMALIENIQREDLDPLEEAQALRQLQTQYNLTHAEVAHAVGRSRAAVSNLLRLLDLPPPICELLRSHRLEMGHARALVTLAPDLAIKLANEAADQGWSVRAVESRVHDYALGRVPPAPTERHATRRKPVHADIASLENKLSESLGTRVAIHHQRNGKGRMVIHYNDLDSLDGVLERIERSAHH